MPKTDLEAVREELRTRAVEEQNHVALHLFAENDVLREIIAGLAKERKE